MRFVLILVLGVLSFGGQFEGVLDPKLTKPSGLRWHTAEIHPATEVQRSQIPLVLTADDRVWVGDALWGEWKRARKLAIMKRADDKCFLLVDVNANGTFEKDEIREFQSADNKSQTCDLHWDFPLSSAPFRSLPVDFRFPMVTTKDGQPLALGINDWFWVTGSVHLRDRQVRVVFDYDPARGGIDPGNTRLGIDANEDGEVDFGPQSPESARAQNETVVFRVEDLYLSFASVDVPNLRFTMRSHPASDYERIELVPGAQVPDFEFVDFSGKNRRLSDFRGKFVLLDFWGSWCAPCVAQLPELREAYAKYRQKGFEIIGIDNDETQAAAEKVLAKNNCGWTNARTDSVKQLYEKRFRIVEWPTLVLLDPRGKILSSDRPGQLGLDGPALETTLEQLLGKSR